MKTDALSTVSADARDWLEDAIRAIRTLGYSIVTDVLTEDVLDQSRSALYEGQRRIAVDIGHDRLAAAGEIGTLRLLLKYHAHFFRFLEVPEMLALVDALLSPTAILHTQNGLILPSFDKGSTPSVFQNTYHRDFPRYLNGYIASLSVLFAIDDFTTSNGATLVVPGSHQQEAIPANDELAALHISAEAPAGSMLVFDATLWHAAGQNTSGSDRLGINHQFTRSFFKQQIDYVRALGDDTVLAQSPRTQQLLGWYTRTVTSLDEYYQPEEKRLFRRHQG